MVTDDDEVNVNKCDNEIAKIRVILVTTKWVVHSSLMEKAGG